MNKPTPSQVDQRRGLNDNLSIASCSNEIQNWCDEKAKDSSTWQPAYEVMVAMGSCRLFGFTPDEPSLMAPIPLSGVEAAIKGAVDITNRVLVQLRDLREDIVDSVIACEAHNYVIDILSGRFDLEAAVIACDESIKAAKQAGVDTAEILGCYVTLKGLIRRLDDRICEESYLLAKACETYWVENLLGDLAETAWQPRPWWLTDKLAELYETRTCVVKPSK